MPSGQLSTQSQYQFDTAKKETLTTKEPQTARCEELTGAVNQQIYHLGVLIWGPTLVTRLVRFSEFAPSVALGPDNLRIPNQGATV